MHTTKVLVSFVLLMVVSADDNGGRYSADQSGQYFPTGDEGQYIPDDSGQYYPDDSGLYVDDGTGKYKHINGRYSDDGRGQYRGQNDNFGSGGNRGFRGGNDNAFKPRPIARAAFSRSKTPSPFNPNLIGTAYEPKQQLHDKSSSNFGGSSSSGVGSSHTNQDYQTGAGAFGNAAAGTSNDDSRHYHTGRAAGSGKFSTGKDGRWRIIKQNGDVGSDGYHWDYETENGIVAEETGKVANKGSDLEAMRAKGFFKYTGPDNVLYTVTYTADENGFVAKGNHLPTPPPIPDAILKAIELQKSSTRKF